MNFIGQVLGIERCKYNAENYGAALLVKLIHKKATTTVSASDGLSAEGLAARNGLSERVKW